MDKKLIRKKFRDAVFKRDKYTCRICGQVYTEEESDPSLSMVNAHHITDRTLLENGGYVKENGITVCDEKGRYSGTMSCHLLVEQCHILGGDEDLVEEQYRPSTLYLKIDSSLELAIKKSKQLK